MARIGCEWTKEGGKRVEGKIRIMLKQVSEDCYANTRQTTLAWLQNIGRSSCSLFFFCMGQVPLFNGGEGRAGWDASTSLPENNPKFQSPYSFVQRSYHGLSRRPLLTHCLRRLGRWQRQRPGGWRLLLQRADGGEPGERGRPLLRAVSIVRVSPNSSSKETNLTYCFWICEGRSTAGLGATSTGPTVALTSLAPSAAG